jgi:hypothetical protein
VQMPTSSETPSFLAPDWCGLSWSAFVPFGAARDQMRTITKEPGLYRGRVAGAPRLAYVGQTGRDLRDRVSSLARGALAPEMPFNDPHTAAPKLWSYRVADRLEYEVSVAECALPKNDRMGRECELVWRYRLEAGASPLCNFGRLHPRYVTSGNRATRQRGQRLTDHEPNNDGGPSVPALALFGTPDGPDWMGLSWTVWAPLTAKGVMGVPAGPGVYRIRSDLGVLYIGQSATLGARLRTHARRDDWPGAVDFSVSQLPLGYTPTQRLEVENDLIAGHFAQVGHSPPMQFGQETAPAD